MQYQESSLNICELGTSLALKRSLKRAAEEELIGYKTKTMMLVMNHPVDVLAPQPKHSKCLCFYNNLSVEEMIIHAAEQRFIDFLLDGVEEEKQLFCHYRYKSVDTIVNDFEENRLLESIRKKWEMFGNMWDARQMKMILLRLRANREWCVECDCTDKADKLNFESLVCKNLSEGEIRAIFSTSPLFEEQINLIVELHLFTSMKPIDKMVVGGSQIM